MAKLLQVLFDTKPFIFPEDIEIRSITRRIGSPKAPDAVSALIDGRLTEFKRTRSMKGEANINSMAANIADGLNKSEDVFLLSYDFLSDIDEDELFRRINMNLKGIDILPGEHVLVMIDQELGYAKEFKIRKETADSAISHTGRPLVDLISHRRAQLENIIDGYYVNSPNPNKKIAIEEYRKEESGIVDQDAQKEDSKRLTVEEAENLLSVGLRRIGGLEIDEGSTRMDVSSVRALYDLAEEAEAEFRRTIEDIQKNLGIPDSAVSYRKELKDPGRVVEKALNDYDGDVGRVLDANGATFSFNRYGDAKEAYNRVLNILGSSVVKKKALIMTYGYKDFKINIQMSNGFIGELILLDQDIFWIKNNGVGHKLYELERVLAPFLAETNIEKNNKLFGEETVRAISGLNEALEAGSCLCYENAAAIRAGQYDKEGLAANLYAVSLSITELSNQLRSNFDASYLVGLSSIMPSGVDLSMNNSQVSSSLLKAVSQISKYLTAIENTSTSSKSQNGEKSNGTIVFQNAEGTALQDIGGTLVVTHNLTADNLRASIDIGGMPMPSLAVTHPDVKIDSFGEITLVGDSEMASSLMRNGEIFDRDMWSPVVPRPEYRIDRKAMQRFESWLEGLSSDPEFRFPGLASLMDYQKNNADSLASFYAGKDGVRLAYAREHGVDIDIPRRPARYSYDERIIKAALQWGKSNDARYLDYSDRTSFHNAISPAVEQVIRDRLEALERTSAEHPEDRKFLRRRKMIESLRGQIVPGQLLFSGSYAMEIQHTRARESLYLLCHLD